MRTALLSARRHNSEGELRALARMAGRSILSWQADFARELGCQRIICLSDAPSPELLALQRELEADGLEFHLVRSSMQVLALLRSGDQLVMVLDGLLTQSLDPNIIDARGDRLAAQVLTLSADTNSAVQHPDEFERIDATRHWAGIAVIGSATVQKLADCPPDGEVMSLLLRLALQDGAVCKAMPLDTAEAEHDLIAMAPKALAERENQLLAKHLGDLQWSGPSIALSKLAAAKLVRSDLKVSSGMIAGAMIATALIAALLFRLEQPAIGLLALAVGALLGQIASSSATLRCHLRNMSKKSIYSTVLTLFIDGLSIAGLIAALGPETAPIEKMVIPVFAIGLARIASQTDELQFVAFWRDRATHLLIFAIAAFGGWLSGALILFGLGALAYNLLRGRGN